MTRWRSGLVVLFLVLTSRAEGAGFDESLSAPFPLYLQMSVGAAGFGEAVSAAFSLYLGLEMTDGAFGEGVSPGTALYLEAPFHEVAAGGMGEADGSGFVLNLGPRSEGEGVSDAFPLVTHLQTTIRVTSDVWKDHENDPPVVPAPVLEGVTVSAQTTGGTFVQTTDENGVALLPVVPTPGVEFMLNLWGPKYRVRSTEQALNSAPVHITQTISASPMGSMEFRWPHGRGLQVAFFLERFRRDFWRPRFDYEWDDPDPEGRAILATCYMRKDSLLGGASSTQTAIECQGSQCLESDAIFHEYTHLVLRHRTLIHSMAQGEAFRRTLGLECCDPSDPGNGDCPTGGFCDEAGAMDEALADYFPTSFNGDPIIHGSDRDLRHPSITSYPRDPLSQYDYEAHRASGLLSGPLWTIRTAIGDSVSADLLVWAALDSMLAAQPVRDAVYLFQDFYVAMRQADAGIFGGVYATVIDAAFAERNLGPSTELYAVLRWGNDNGIVWVEEPTEEDIILSWVPIPNARSYTVFGKRSGGWGSNLGNYEVLAAAIADTEYVFTDRDAQSAYTFTVAAVDSTGQEGYMARPVSVQALDVTAVPIPPDGRTGRKPGIAAVTPNPTRGEAKVFFYLTSAGEVAGEVFDVAGRRIQELGRRWYSAGGHEVVWDGRDGFGRKVGSGVYVVRMSAKDWTGTRKVLLLR